MAYPMINYPLVTAMEIGIKNTLATRQRPTNSICSVLSSATHNNITVESRDYAPPPFVHARIGQKWGGGLYEGS